MDGLQKLTAAYSIALGVLLVCVHSKYEYLIFQESLSHGVCAKVLCENIVCKKVDSCFDVIVPNATYCGCCPACVKYLAEDSPCEDIHETWTKVSSKCIKGLICQNGRCVLDPTENPTNCLVQRHFRTQRKGIGDYSNDLWLPECDRKGAYKARQVKGRRNICLDENGFRIFGTGAKASPRSCACSRRMKTLLTRNPNIYNIQPQEHCSSTGSYEKIQCKNNLCYCANEEKGQIKGQLVRIDSLEKLSCFEDGISEIKYLKPCEEELQRSRRLIYELYVKGVELVGLQNVNCDFDGLFSPKQCQPDRCVCTDPNGIGIGSYAIATEDLEKLGNTAMTCNCARARNYAKNIYHCKGHGNYAQVQCFNSEQCYCVDDDGDIISKNLSRATNSEKCLKILQNLSKFPGDELKTTKIDEEIVTDDYYNT